MDCQYISEICPARELFLQQQKYPNITKQNLIQLYTEKNGTDMTHKCLSCAMEFGVRYTPHLQFILYITIQFIKCAYKKCRYHTHFLAYQVCNVFYV